MKRDLGNEHRKTSGSFSYLNMRVIINLVCPEKPLFRLVFLEYLLIMPIESSECPDLCGKLLWPIIFV